MSLKKRFMTLSILMMSISGTLAAHATSSATATCTNPSANYLCCVNAGSTTQYYWYESISSCESIDGTGPSSSCTSSTDVSSYDTGSSPQPLPTCTSTWNIVS